MPDSFAPAATLDAVTVTMIPVGQSSVLHAGCDPVGLQQYFAEAILVFPAVAAHHVPDYCPPVVDLQLANFYAGSVDIYPGHGTLGQGGQTLCPGLFFVEFDLGTSD